MKKVLPLLLFVILAFASCQRGPVIYQVSNNPKEMADNAEKFAKQTIKRSGSYNAEEWKVAVEQFIAMTKDFVDKKHQMSQDDIFRVDAARLEFIKAVSENGNDELVAQIKEAYSQIDG
jgi:hypothetical protein